MQNQAPKLVSLIQQTIANCESIIQTLPEEQPGDEYPADLELLWGTLGKARLVAQRFQAILGCDPGSDLMELLETLSLLPAARRPEVKKILDNLVIRSGGRPFLKAGCRTLSNTSDPQNVLEKLDDEHKEQNMNFSSSYTDLNGLTVSLAVSASASYPEPLCEALSQPLAVADLAASAFEQAIPELSGQLVQAHSAAALALHKSYVEALQQEVDGFDKSQGKGLDRHFKFSIMSDSSDILEVEDLATGTAITLKKDDIAILIGALQNLHQTSSPQKS